MEITENKDGTRTVKLTKDNVKVVKHPDGRQDVIIHAPIAVIEILARKPK